MKEHVNKKCDWTSAEPKFLPSSNSQNKNKKAEIEEVIYDRDKFLKI